MFPNNTHITWWCQKTAIPNHTLSKESTIVFSHWSFPEKSVAGLIFNGPNQHELLNICFNFFSKFFFMHYASTSLSLIISSISVLTEKHRPARLDLRWSRMANCHPWQVTMDGFEHKIYHIFMFHIKVWKHSSWYW